MIDCKKNDSSAFIRLHKWVYFTLGSIFVAYLLECLFIANPQFNSTSPEGFYGWQTEALLKGHTWLDVAPDPALSQLKDPYDGAQNAPYRILDLSYYKGRYYIYFGIGPVVSLFLPWKLVTGYYLTEPAAAFLFSIGKFALLLILVESLWRRYFSNIGGAPIITVAILLGFGDLSSLHLFSSRVYQVAQTGAYFYLALTLFTAHASLHSVKSKSWLAVSGLAAGAAAACRPTFVVAIVVTLPVILALWHRRERRFSETFKLVLAAGSAFALIVSGLLIYNYIRFRSFLEFGNHYQLNDLNQNHIGVLSWKYVSRNLSAYFLTRPHFVHYFPFIELPGASPLGIGLGLPFAWLGSGLFSLVCFKKNRPYRLETLAIGTATAVVFLMLLLFTSMYFWCEARYEADILWLLLLFASLGWLVGLSTENLLISKVCRYSGYFTASISLILSSLFVALVGTSDEQWSRLHRIANIPISYWDELRGVAYGPVRLKLIFPGHSNGQVIPLLSSGYNNGDLVYAKMTGEDSVAFGFFHAGIGGPVSEPITLDLSKAHEVEIYMGSLLPPKSDRFFNGWPPELVHRAKNTLKIKVDRAEVLNSFADFYESGPDNVLVGKNPSLSDVAAGQFSGTVLKVARVPFVKESLPLHSLVDTGVVTIHFRLPVWRGGQSTQPILSTGESGRGDLVYITCLPDLTVRFGLDHWGRAYVSKPVRLDMETVHTLTVVSNALARSSEEKNNFEILCDDRQVLFLQLKTYESQPDQIYYGLNAIGSSICSPMFGGTILSVMPGHDAHLRSTNLPFSPSVDGTVNLSVLFGEYGQNHGQGQPLLVSGETGKADIIYVMLTDAHHLRVGFDHWGVGGKLGDRVEFDPNVEHRLTIDLGSLHALGSKHAARNNEYKVTMDGQTVLEGISDLYPADLTKVFIGKNPAGGSTTGTLFEGEIVDLTTLP